MPAADDEIIGYGPALIRDGRKFLDLAARFNQKTSARYVLRSLADPHNFGDGPGKQAALQFIPILEKLLTAVGGYPGQVRNVGVTLVAGGQAVVTTGEQNRRTADSLGVSIERGTAVDLGALGGSHVPNVSGSGSDRGDVGGGDSGGDTGTVGRR